MPTLEDIPLKFDSIEDSIAAFKRGEFIVVLDNYDRENEGDLIIAAEDLTTEKMAFMIRYSSGFVCAPLTIVQATKLDLPQMVAANADPNQTRYCISIDSSDPTITTGISAHDRALTIRTLANPKVTASHFRRPGHVLPLKAHSGGIRARQGHTEAAVEFCRLAGKSEVGAICEMVEDGKEVEGVAEMKDAGMMRADSCLKFGKKWGLKVCTIDDLVEYVERERKSKTYKIDHGVAHEDSNGLDQDSGSDIAQETDSDVAHVNGNGLAHEDGNGSA